MTTNLCASAGLPQCDLSSTRVGLETSVDGIDALPEDAREHAGDDGEERGTGEVLAGERNESEDDGRQHAHDETPAARD